MTTSVASFKPETVPFKEIKSSGVRRPALAFERGNAPYQKELQFTTSANDTVSTPFPGILVPSHELSAEQFITAVSELSQQPLHLSSSVVDKSVLREELTARGGAIQFKKTPLRTAEDFSRFMHACGEGARWTHHIDKGLMVLRRPFAENVATANEGPPHQPIGSHNEYGLSSHYPSYIAFFCLSPPEEGGQTPIASSLALYEKLKVVHPEILEAIQRKGVTFNIHHPRTSIENNLQGNGLFTESAFGPSGDVNIEQLSEAQKRKLVEDNVASLAAEGGWDPIHEDDPSQPLWKRRGFSANWQDDGSLVVQQRVPGVRSHPVFNVPTYFNNIHNRILYSELYGSPESDYIRGNPATSTDKVISMHPPQITELDGDSEFPDAWKEVVKRVTAELQVDVEWEVGDVLVLDNLAVQHGRRPWKGDRRLLASLWDA